MKKWKKLDLLGRGIILAAIMFQLTLVSEVRAVKQNGDVAYLMENQAAIALMLLDLGSSKSSEMSKTYSDLFTLYSKWNNSNLHYEVTIINIIFVIVFLVGSALTLVARYFELNE